MEAGVSLGGKDVKQVSTSLVTPWYLSYMCDSCLRVIRRDTMLENLNSKRMELFLGKKYQ